MPGRGGKGPRARLRNGSGAGTGKSPRDGRSAGKRLGCQRIQRRAGSFAGRGSFGYSNRAMAEARAEERSIWREYTEALIIAAVFLLFTNTFVVQTFYIPSG